MPTKIKLGWGKGAIVRDEARGTLGYVMSGSRRPEFEVDERLIVGVSIERDPKQFWRTVTIHGAGTTLARLRLARKTADVLAGWLRDNVAGMRR